MRVATTTRSIAWKTVFSFKLQRFRAILQKSRSARWRLFARSALVLYIIYYIIYIIYYILYIIYYIQGATREKRPPCRPRFLKVCFKLLELETDNSFPCDAASSCLNSHVCFSLRCISVCSCTRKI